MVASPRRSARGSSTAIAKFSSTDGRALGYALAGLRRSRLGKISGIWQRYPSSLPPRARARLGRHDAARPARSAWSVQRPVAARFDGEVAGGAVADSVLVIFGSGRRWSSGDSMVRSPAVGAIDDDDDVGFGERRRWWRRRVAQLGGHRQRSPNSPALTVGRLAMLSPGCAGRGSERSAEFGSVTHLRCLHARARGLGGTMLLDLLDRPGQCSGRWPHDSMVKSPAAPSPIPF